MITGCMSWIQFIVVYPPLMQKTLLIGADKLLKK